MKFEVVNAEEMSKLVCKKKRISMMIEDFWKSDLQVVRVEFNENEYRNISSAQACFSKSAKNMKVGVFAVMKVGVFAVTRNGKLYLVKEKI